MRFVCLALVLLLHSNAMAAQNLRTGALELGRKVDHARQSDASEAEIAALLASVARLRERAHQARYEREREAGESEAGLGRLYRSQDWTDTGFTLAAMRYWHSWLLLERHKHTASQADLSAARRGFQTTLALIVYPGLARGSWLGMGHVNLAAGELAAAETWFKRVAVADDALAEHARGELALLAALREPTESYPTVNLSQAEANALEREALALLERHSKKLDGASRAAVRLRQLEASGNLDVERVTRLLKYRDEIIGHPIGPTGLLISAENALAHEQFYTAVEKYRAFFGAIGEQRRREFTDFRLRFVSALLGAALIEEALAELGRVDAEKVTDGAALQSLRLVAAAHWYASNGGDTARGHLAATAAEQQTGAAAFVTFLLQGQLDNIVVGASTLPEFELIVQEYRRSDHQNPALAALAEQAYAGLPAELAQLPAHRVARAHIRAAIVTNPQRYLAELSALVEALPDEYADQLFAARIKYLRFRAPARLVAEITALANPPDEFKTNVLLSEVLGCEGEHWCLVATQALGGLLAPGSDAHLFTMLQQIRELNDDVAAYQLAAATVEQYPASGDALRVFAQTAAAAGRTGDAEAAYARLADSLPIGSRQWREARLAQVDLRIRAGATDGLCGFSAIAYGDDELVAAIKQRLNKLQIRCPNGTVG